MSLFLQGTLLLLRAACLPMTWSGLATLAYRYGAREAKLEREALQRWEDDGGRT